MQMATYTMVVLVFSFIYETRHQLATADSITGLVFQGFTIKAWGVVVINAVGGLLVALVIKYADNILRGFSSALATINSTLLAMVCFGFEVGGGFLLGTAMVIGSAMLYGGVVKIPGDWWNTDPGLCGVTPIPTTKKVSKKSSGDLEMQPDPTSPAAPHAEVVGNSEKTDEETKAILATVK
jgi:UDP-sugar transporter A1/2/3